jgi:hypothetical protein
VLAPTLAVLGPRPTVLLNLISVERRIDRCGRVVRLRDVIAAPGNLLHAIHQFRHKLRRCALRESKDRLRCSPESGPRVRWVAARGVPLSASLTERLRGAGPQAASGLSGRTEILAHLADTASEALPELTDALSESPDSLTDRAALTQRLSSRVAHAADRLARGPSGLDSLLCCLTHIAQRLRNSSTGSNGLLPKLANVPERVINGLDKALQDLWVLVEGRQCPVEDVVEVLETHLQPRLCLDALDVDPHLSEVDVDAGNHLEQIRELCPKRQMRL